MIIERLIVQKFKLHRTNILFFIITSAVPLLTANSLFCKILYTLFAFVSLIYYQGLKFSLKSSSKDSLDFSYLIPGNHRLKWGDKLGYVAIMTACYIAGWWFAAMLWGTIGVSDLMERERQVKTLLEEEKGLSKGRKRPKRKTNGLLVCPNCQNKMKLDNLYDIFICGTCGNVKAN